MPAAEGGGTAAQVEENVEHFPADYTYQLALRLLELIVQAAQDAVCGVRMIVLNELSGDADFREKFFVVALEEIPARILKDFWFEDEGAGERSFEDFHGRVRVRILAL